MEPPMRLILAYIDPGAGSLLIQAALAAVLSVPFIFRSALRRAIDRIHRKPAGDTDKARTTEVHD